LKKIETRLISGLECVVPTGDGRKIVFFISTENIEVGLEAIETFMESEGLDMGMYMEFMTEALEKFEGMN
jgi:hypothetical protein